MLHKALDNFFQAPFTITKISGGFSAASNYMIVAKKKRYVLRQYPAEYPLNEVEKEFYALEHGAEIGIAPSIYHIFLEDRAILMDYIGKPWTMSQAKQPNSCQKMALALRQLHGMSRNPFVSLSVQEKTERFYQQPFIKPSESLPKEAIQLIRQGNVALGNLPHRELTTIHGDLNPRNIFLTDKEVLLIDWSETNWDDPFYDLSSIALLHDYSLKEETFFLETYLQHSMTEAELKHYLIVKKIQLATLSLTCYGITKNLLFQFPEQRIDASAPLKSLHHYIAAFAKNDPNLPAQFFFELAQGALDSALELHY